MRPLVQSLYVPWPSQFPGGQSVWRSPGAHLSHSLVLERILLQTEKQHRFPVTWLRQTQLTCFDDPTWHDLVLGSFEGLVQAMPTIHAVIMPVIMDWATKLGTFRGLPGMTWPTHDVLRAMMTRITYAHALTVGHAPEHRVHYEAWRFIDTHLDLLVHVVEHGAPSVEQLDACYPLPHRILCPEELPDLTSHVLSVDLLMDSGKGKKHLTLQDEVIHLLCKLMNQICHIRHLGDTILEYMHNHVEIEHLVRLGLKCSLLGNFPKSLKRMRLAGRVRLQMQLTMDTPDLRSLSAWIERHPFTTMFALRDMFLYTCEASGVVDAFLAKHVKWPAFKALSRHTMDVIRAELSTQAERDFHGPTEWNVIEAPPKPRKVTKKQRLLGILPPPPPLPGTPRLPPGIVNRSHNQMLSTCVKLSKGLTHDVVLKKMISEEAAVLDHHVRLAILKDAGLRAILLALFPPGSEHDLLAGQPKKKKKKKKKKKHEDEEDSDMEEEEEDDEFEVTRLVELLVECRALPVVTARGTMAMEIQRLHADALAAFRTKGTPGQAKKTLAPTLWDAFHDHVASTVVLPPIQKKLARLAEPFHIVAQHVAYKMTRPQATMAERDTPELKWLLALGMDKDNVDEIGIWFYRYAHFAQPDDRYKHWARFLGQRSLYDFLALELYLRLIEQNMDTSLVFLGEDMMKRQTLGIRKQLSLLGHEPTPPEAGKVLYCLGCEHWITSIQHPPVWVTCRGDDLLTEAECDKLTRLNRERPLTPADHVRKLLPPGHSKARWVMDEHGIQPWCPGAHVLKQGLQAHTQWDEDEASDIDMGDDDGPVATDEQPPIKNDKSLKADRQHVCLRARKLLHVACEPVSHLGMVTCHAQPLLKVDMLGMMIRLGKNRGGEWMSLCCHCGNLIVVSNMKVTNHGFSCMNHPELNEYPVDHWLRDGWTRVSDLLVETHVDPCPLPILGQRPREEVHGYTHPLLLQRPLPCAYCADHATYKRLVVYDSRFVWRHVPLCEQHLYMLRPVCPALRMLGKRTMAHWSIPPLPLDLVLEKLNRGRPREVLVTHGPTPIPDAVEQLQHALAKLPEGELERRLRAEPDLLQHYQRRDMLSREAHIRVLETLLHGGSETELDDLW